MIKHIVNVLNVTEFCTFKWLNDKSYFVHFIQIFKKETESYVTI